jgi:hypothetical protein
MGPNILLMAGPRFQYKQRWEEYVLSKNTPQADKWTVWCHPPKQSKIDIGIKVEDWSEEEKRKGVFLARNRGDAGDAKSSPLLLVLSKV